MKKDIVFFLTSRLYHRKIPNTVTKEVMWFNYSVVSVQLDEIYLFAQSELCECVRFSCCKSQRRRADAQHGVAINGADSDADGARALRSRLCMRSASP